MKNKILIELIVPKMERSFNVYLPINKTIGNLIVLLNKAVSEISENMYDISNCSCLYNRDTKVKYDADILLYNTDIRNGTSLVLI